MSGTGSWKAMVERPRDARKKLCSVRQATLSLCRICKKVQKPHCGKAFFGWMSKILFFTCLIWKKKLLGVEVATEYHELDRAIIIALKLHVKIIKVLIKSYSAWNLLEERTFGTPRHVEQKRIHPSDYNISDGTVNYNFDNTFLFDNVFKRWIINRQLNMSILTTIQLFRQRINRCYWSLNTKSIDIYFVVFK